MSDFELKAGKIVINNLEDIERVIKEKFPDGLETKRKQDVFDGGAFIGFNLCRYGYTELLAAECHAMRDSIQGRVGYSYGCPFDPHVVTHKEKNGKDEWYEVYTE
jgi:hypothetical protein